MSATGPTNCNHPHPLSDYVNESIVNNYLEIRSLSKQLVKSKMHYTVKVLDRLNNKTDQYYIPEWEVYLHILNKNPALGGEYFYPSEYRLVNDTISLRNGPSISLNGNDPIPGYRYKGILFFLFRNEVDKYKQQGGQRKISKSKKHVRRSRLRSRTHKRSLRSRA